MGVDPDAKILIDALSARIAALESAPPSEVVRQVVQYIVKYGNGTEDVFNLVAST